MGSIPKKKRDRVDWDVTEIIVPWLTEFAQGWHFYRPSISLTTFLRSSDLVFFCLPIFWLYLIRKHLSNGSVPYLEINYELKEKSFSISVAQVLVLGIRFVRGFCTIYSFFGRAVQFFFVFQRRHFHFEIFSKSDKIEAFETFLNSMVVNHDQTGRIGSASLPNFWPTGI